MMDKCEFYTEDAKGCYLAGCVPQGFKTIVNFKCEHNPNCYYKQLKGLEAENKALKRKNESLEYYKFLLETRVAELYRTYNSPSLYPINQAEWHEIKGFIQEIEEVTKQALEIRYNG